MTQESISSKLTELFELYKSGALTTEEYEQLKSQIIGQNIAQPREIKVEESINEPQPAGEKENIISNVKSSKSKSKKKLIYKIVVPLLVLSLIIVAIIIGKDSIPDSEATQPSDSIGKNLEVKIKSIVKSKTFEIDAWGEVQDKTVNRLSYEYNINGALVSITNLEGNSPVKAFEYNDKGLKISDKEFRDGSNSVIHTYQYDYDGNLVERISSSSYNSNNLFDKYVYDGKGNMISHDFRFADGQYGEKAFHYDDKSRLVKERRLIPNGTFSIVKTNSYNDEDFTRIEKIYEDGNVKYTNKYKYDSKWQLIEEDYEWFEEKGSIKYDDNENVIEKYVRQEMTSNAGDSDIDISKWEYKYDTMGNLIEEIRFRQFNDGKMELYSKDEFSYDYDKFDNWVKKTTTSKGEIVEVLERSFEYY